MFVPFVENLYNGLHDAERKLDSFSHNLEIADFIIHECFIDVTALLLHYEQYLSLHDILARPYFTRIDERNESIERCDYTSFHAYSNVLEEVCKPRSEKPTLFTMTGDILVSRSYGRILSKATIVNADIVLYQLSRILLKEEKIFRWFPTTYVYNPNEQLIWQKMVSKSHCKKLFDLFGVTSIEQLKQSISSSLPTSRAHYPGSFDYAPEILSSISIDEIGTVE